MPTFLRSSSRAWIAATVLLVGMGSASGQTFQQQRDQQRAMDELRFQRQQSQQRLGDDLSRRLQQQDQRSQQLQLENQIRRQQLREDLERHQRR
jgi:hypothetical protein